MTARSAALEADLAAVTDLTYVAGRTVVALPPSTADPLWDEMRVAVGIPGTLISRAFDPGADIVTGAPLLFMTEGGDELLTEAGETITTETAA